MLGANGGGGGGGLHVSVFSFLQSRVSCLLQQQRGERRKECAGAGAGAAVSPLAFVSALYFVSGIILTGIILIVGFIFDENCFREYV